MTDPKRKPLPGAEVRALDISGRFPTERTRTEETGRFEFTTLSSAEYRLFVDEAYSSGGTPVIKTGEADVTLRLTLAKGSRLRLGTPVAR